MIFIIIAFLIALATCFLMVANMKKSDTNEVIADMSITIVFFGIVTFGVIFAATMGSGMPKVTETAVIPLYNWGSEESPCYVSADDWNFTVVPDGEDHLAISLKQRNRYFQGFPEVEIGDEPVLVTINTRFEYPWMIWFGISSQIGERFDFFNLPNGSIVTDRPPFEESNKE